MKIALLIVLAIASLALIASVLFQSGNSAGLSGSIAGGAEELFGKKKSKGYESVVASELAAHGHKLFYYDNRNKGEVDYLIDDYDSLSAVPIEVKSGKDYTIHSALNNFVKNEDYHIKKAFVVSNERTIRTDGKITYLPIYYVMFF